MGGTKLPLSLIAEIKQLMNLQNEDKSILNRDLNKMTLLSVPSIYIENLLSLLILFVIVNEAFFRIALEFNSEKSNK